MTPLFLSTLSTPSEICELTTTLVVCLVVAFSLWQFRGQYDKLRHGDFYWRGLTARGKRFYRRQATRRLQIACLSGVAGALMLTGLFTSARAHPKLVSGSWTLAILLCFWIGALAIVDAISVWFSFEEERQRRDAEKLALEFKMKKFQEESLDSLREESSNETDEEAGTSN